MEKRPVKDLNTKLKFSLQLSYSDGFQKQGLVSNQGGRPPAAEAGPSP